MYGVKLYAVPDDVDSAIQKWHSLNFDTLFIGQGCKNDTAFLKRLQQEGFFVNLIEPVFLADEKLDEKFLAVTKNGSPASQSWVRFVCPSNKKWLSNFFKRIKNDSKLCVNSLSLDFIRFFQFWEILTPADTSDILQETCFCKKCTKQMKKFSSEAEWRCSVINGIAKKARSIITKYGKTKQMGLHTVPWKSTTFNGGAKKILGQDLEALSEYVDFFTPMTYHHMMKTDVSYIGELLDDFSERTDKKIVPSVQLKKYYRDEDIPMEENEQAINTALSHGNNNLVFFQWNDIDTNQDITALLQNTAEKIIKQ